MSANTADEFLPCESCNGTGLRNNPDYVGTKKMESLPPDPPGVTVFTAPVEKEAGYGSD